MATRKGIKTYNASIKFAVEVGVEIEASSLEEAIEEAKKLSVGDLINFKESGVEHNDSSTPIVTGVYRYEPL